MPGTEKRMLLPGLTALPQDYQAGQLPYSAKSNTRNHTPGTNCTENAVSCMRFWGLSAYAMPDTIMVYAATRPDAEIAKAEWIPVDKFLKAPQSLSPLDPRP
eukprot:2175997-Rhodomonas_salina.1